MTALGRCADIWGSDADQFIPDRWQAGAAAWKVRASEATRNAYLPFGRGPRKCPGQVYGLIALDIFVAALIRHCRWERSSGAGALLHIEPRQPAW